MHISKMNKIVVFSCMVAALATAPSTASHAQAKKKPVSKIAPTKKQPATKTVVKDSNAITADGYTHLPSGLEYKIARHGVGKKHPNVRDHLEMHVHVHIKDSTIFDSRKMNNGNAVPFQVQPPSFRGDFIEGLMLMVAGDSCLLRLPVDSIISQNKQLMPGMKAGDVLEYDVVLVSVMTNAEYKKDQYDRTEAQKKLDSIRFEDYFARNSIVAKRTPSGLYYTIANEGSGETAKPGQVLSVFYTGRFLEGKTFDSNKDPEFHHPEAFPVTLGRGGVIKGWEEGLALLKAGSKATLYIPSYLAYGLQGNSNIPPNTVLVFDVEIASIKTQAEVDDKLITDYMAKNNIKATKTASGLYVAITSEGKGEMPAKGQKVAVNYTGMTIDGRKFDSNTDSAFHHMQPLEFALGQGAVIKGWDEGIGMLKQGTKATLLIPSAIAYGARGQQGAGIAPNAVLIFNVELVDIKK